MSAIAASTPSPIAARLSRRSRDRAVDVETARTTTGVVTSSETNARVGGRDHEVCHQRTHHDEHAHDEHA